MQEAGEVVAMTGEARTAAVAALVSGCMGECPHSISLLCRRFHWFCRNCRPGIWTRCSHPPAHPPSSQPAHRALKC